MSARDILENYAARNGWDLDSMLTVICEYVDCQKDNEGFREFVETTSDDEVGCDQDCKTK